MYQNLKTKINSLNSFARKSSLKRDTVKDNENIIKNMRNNQPFGGEILNILV